MPYSSYLVFGTVYDSDGFIASYASIEVITSIGNKTYESDANGIYLFDLADIGYSNAETVKLNLKDEFDNEYINHTFVVSGAYHEEDITLDIRTDALRATDYSPKSILHTVGKNPVTPENPLAVRGPNILEDFFISDQITVGEYVYFGYLDKKGRWYIMRQGVSDGTYRYVKGSYDYSTNWANKGALTYALFSEVF